MKYKLLVLDIDDTTLILRSHNLTPFTLETLQKVNNLGIKIMVNTGRVSIGVPDDYYKIPISFLSSSNGAKVRDLNNNTLISQTLIPYQTAAKIYQYLEQSKAFYLSFINDLRFVTDSSIKKLPTIRHSNKLAIAFKQLNSLSD